jgi:hypothetical protein
MKTRTYARLALLIPILIWVILLLVEILINVVIPANLRSDGLLALLEIVPFFYVFGILFWFLPYLILSIFLLSISFISRLEVLKYLFFLSPFVMAVLVMLEVTIISLPLGDYAFPDAGLLSTFMTTAGINLLMGILALIFGYGCVGLGLGGYILLQRFGMIDDVEKKHVEITNLTSQAV